MRGPRGQPAFKKRALYVNYTTRHCAGAALAAALSASALVAPHANAYETTYDSDKGQCTITFTDTDTERVNGAYSALFTRLGEQVRDSVEGDDAQAQAEIVWEYGSRKGVASASDLPVPADKKVSDAQAALALGKQKDKYWRMVGFLNAAKKDVITDQTITMTPAKAHEEGPLHGVDFGPVVGGTVGGILFGTSLVDIRDGIIDAAKTHAPEFAAPILSYSQAFSDCADGKTRGSSVLPASSMTSSQTTGLGVAGVVLGLFALVGLGYAARPFVDDALAQFQP